MLILSIIFIGCLLVAYLNFKFWKLHPDQESDEYAETEYQHEVNEYGNPPIQEHYRPPVWHEISWWLNWICVLAAIGFVILVIVNAIK